MLRKAVVARNAFANAVGVSYRQTGLSEADMELLSRTQQALHFARLPRDLRNEKKLADHLATILGRPFLPEAVFLQRTRLGAFTGQGVVRLKASESPSLKTLKSGFPEEMVLRPLDEFDTRNFFEQCRRLHSFTDDLRGLVSEGPENAVVTVTGVPDTYGVSDVKAVIKAKVPDVKISSVVFPFEAHWGVQQSTVFIRTKTSEQADKVVDAIGSDHPVPIRRLHGVNFGTALLSASKSTLFVSSDKMPSHQLYGSKYWVMSMGWKPQTSEAQFLAEMHKLRIFPENIDTLTLSTNSSRDFLMKFPRMEDVKKALVKLHRLAMGKGIPRRVVSYA